MNYSPANKAYVEARLAELGTHALKKWGQNFLIDDAVAQAIVQALLITPESRILEIGPGLGALSFHLAQTGRPTTLVEIDPLFAELLQKGFSKSPQIEVIQNDILKTDLSTYDLILGNLPYYLTTPILEQVLGQAGHLRQFIGMIQKEVYPRLSAKIGDEAYGPLAIMASYLGDLKIIQKVNRRCFHPSPNVDSVVFSLTFKPDIDADFAHRLSQVVHQLFALRRKTILNNLTGLLGRRDMAEALLKALGVPANKRPEELPLSFYVEVAKRLA